MTSMPRDSVTSGVEGSVVPEPPKGPELSLDNAKDIKDFNDLEDIKKLVDWVRKSHQSALSLIHI